MFKYVCALMCVHVFVRVCLSCEIPSVCVFVFVDCDAVCLSVL